MAESINIYRDGGRVGMIHSPSVDNFFFFGRFEALDTSTFRQFEELVAGGSEPVVTIGESDDALKGYCVGLDSGEIELRLIP